MISLLRPYMDMPETRQSILQTAWYDSPLLFQVNWTGDPQTFTVLTVRKAIDFGDIEPGVPAIKALLEGLRPQVGYDVQQTIDNLLEECIAGESQIEDKIPILPAATNLLEANHLFISYSSADRAAFVDRLAKDLTQKGYSIWVDNLGPQYNGIVAGNSWKQELANALHEAAIIIFVLTPDSIRSSWCIAELKRARELGKPIIPVLARPISDDDYEILMNTQLQTMPLSEVQYRDFVTLGYDKGLEILLSDILKQS